jgi:hypothetical protein
MKKMFLATKVKCVCYKRAQGARPGQRLESIMKMLCLLFTFLAFAVAQEVLTNDAILKMVKGGLGEDLIVTMIQNQPGKYSTTPDDLLKLKQQRVSDKVLNAMVTKGPAPAAPAPPAAPSASVASTIHQSYQNRPDAADKVQRQSQAAMGVAPPAPSPARGATQAANNTFFVTWRDPREDAFQVGVPQGWQVSGGLMQTNALEPHGVVRLQSPDGKIQIFFDDPDLHPNQVPDQMTQFAGLREGQFLKGAWGGSVMVARYQTGAQFAQQYIRTKLCRQATLTDASELREPTAQMNAILQPYARQERSIAQASVGEAAFQCGGSAGYVMANTFYLKAAAGPTAVMWFVFRLGGYQVSDPQQAGLAYYVLNTLVETFKTNPQWEAKNAQQVQAVTGAVSKMQNDMAKSIAQYGQRQASSASAGGFNHPNTGQLPTDLRKKWAIEDKSLQKFSDATMGQTWMHSSSGSNVRVSNSSTNWWRDYSGNVVAGPESGGPPPGSQGQYERLQPGWQQ